MSDPAAGDVVELARQLIRFNTTVDEPGDAPFEERQCQEFIADRLERLGFEVELFEPSVEELRDHPMYLAGQNWKDRPIVVAHRRGKGGGRSLILNGHIDTVPAGPLKDWSHDPWGAELADQRVYGRGACDMKGGIACLLAACERLIHDGVDLLGDVIIQTVTDEETSGMGTVACIERGIRADAAVVPEPTDFGIWVAFRGIIIGDLIVPGRAAHAEMAQESWDKGGGVSAIEETLPLLNALRTASGEWRNRPDKQHRLMSPPEIRLTRVRGGQFVSTLPESCEVTLNICYLPGEADDHGFGSRVKEEIGNIVNSAISPGSWLEHQPPRIDWRIDVPPSEIPEKEPVVLEFLQAAGPRAWIGGLDTWDDTASLTVLGGIPAISFGPGSNDQAHAADEFVPVKDLVDVTESFLRFIPSWCGTA